MDGERITVGVHLEEVVDVLVGGVLVSAVDLEARFFISGSHHVGQDRFEFGRFAFGSGQFCDERDLGHVKKLARAASAARSGSLDLAVARRIRLFSAQAGVFPRSFGLRTLNAPLPRTGGVPVVCPEFNAVSQRQEVSTVKPRCDLSGSEQPVRLVFILGEGCNNVPSISS